MFGVEDFSFSLKDFDFSKIFWKLAKLKIKKTEIVECFNNPFSVFIQSEKEEFLVLGFCKRMQAIGFGLYVNEKNKFVVFDLETPLEELFKIFYCNG